MSSKFLQETKVYLRPDMSNMTVDGKRIISNVMIDTFIDPITGQFYPYLQTPTPWAGATVYTASNFGDMLNITGMLSGSFCLVQNPYLSSYIYNGSTWIEIAIYPVTFSEIQDIVLTSLTNGQYLTYDQVANKWINSNFPTLGLSNLSDVLLTSVSARDFFIFQSGKWKNIKPVITDISNISITSVSDKQVLIYDSATSLWKNLYMNTSRINDFNIVSPLSRNILRYNTATSTWINDYLSLDDMTDAIISTPSNGQIIKYNGSNWVNSAFGSLDDLTDVSLPALNINYVLLYTGAFWTASKLSLSALNQVAINTPVNDNLFMYDSTIGSWVNKASPYATITNFNNHTSNSAIHRTMPDPLASNNQRVKTITNAYALVDDTVDNLNNVAITSITDNDILKYQVATNKWINKPIKEIVVLNTSRDIVVSDNNKVLSYNSLIPITLTIIKNTMLIGSYIEIINCKESTNLSIVPDDTVSIQSNSQTLFCGRHSLLFKVDANLWIFNTNFNQNLIYRTISSMALPTNTTNRLLQGYYTTTFNNMVICQETLTNIKYLNYDCVSNSYISQISGTLPYSTNILNVSNTNMYNMEYGASNTCILNATTNTYATKTSYTVLTNCATMSNDIFVNSDSKIIFAYIKQTTGDLIIYRMSNTNTAPVITTTSTIIYGCQKLIWGSHLGYMVAIGKNSTSQLSITFTTTVSTNLAQNWNGTPILISGFSDEIEIIRDINATKRMRFISYSYTDVSIWQCDDLNTTAFKLFTISNMDSSLGIGPSYLNGDVIYILVSGVLPSGINGSQLIKYRYQENNLAINNNLFELIDYNPINRIMGGLAFIFTGISAFGFEVNSNASAYYVKNCVL